MSTQFDVIVIGTGAGGGTLALRLAQAGKKILILERGPFMPQEKLNWDTQAVFLDNRYHTKEVWQDKDGKDLHPQQAYFVGGQFANIILDRLHAWLIRERRKWVFL
jgi:choline dehydrogenase-like flavoprotein